MKKQTLARIAIGCLLLLGICLSSQGQQTSMSNSLGLPSANNNFLGKPSVNVSVGVDLYTGTAQVSVPICHLPSRGLDMPITLNYVDGRGVKAQEYASQVGLGWELNAGGSVSRVVRGFPDENSNGYLGPNHYGQTLASILPQSPPPLSGSQFNQFITPCNGMPCSSEPTGDAEPDLYSVQTPFFNFQFAFDPTTGKPAFSNYNGYQVIPYNFINSTNTSASYFEVIDNNGNQFYFGSVANSVESTTDSIYGQVLTFPTSWYLSRIVTYNNSDIITFTYQAGSQPVTTYNYYYTEVLNYLFAYNYTLSTGMQTLPSPKYVSSIVSSEGEVDFTYAFDRQDLTNAARLSQITVKGLNPLTEATTTVLRNYDFNYTYFLSNNGSPYNLRLDNVYLYDAVSGDPALKLAYFTYNTLMSSPTKSQPYFDYWGYATTPPSSPPDWKDINRNPDVNAAQTNILTNITTMEGATWQIFYELNTYGPGINNVGGLRVKELARTLPTGENLNTQYFYVDPANISNSTGELYNTNYSNVSFPIGNSPQQNFMYNSSSPFLTSDLTGNFVGYSIVKEQDQNGGYTLSYFSNFNDAGCSDQSNIGGNVASISASTLPLFSNWTSRAYRRGLLNKQVVCNAAGTTISQTVNNYLGQGPLTYQAWGLHPLLIFANLGTASPGEALLDGWNIYSTPIENYRLTSTTQTTYDQANPNNTPLVTTVNYGYDALDWQVNSTSTTDSKLTTHTQLTYHPYDANIPDLGSGEQTVLNTMVSQNNNLAVIHTKDIRNSTIQESHNTYTSNVYNFCYLSTASAYLNGTMTRQKSYTYDQNYSNLLTTTPLYGKSSGALYGYNNSALIAGLVNAGSTEGFYESFEENTSAVTGAAHSGNAYLNGNYTTSFSPPNSRQYLIQWWNLSSGVWTFNQQNYTQGMVLTGPVDDIRIFPVDAQMTSYTYNPLVGQTSITDPAGKTYKYQYDNFGRLKLKLDQDNNIIQDYAYTYSPAAETIYARLTLQNVTTNGAITSGDLTVSFYSDPAGTQALSVSSLNIGYNTTTPCSGDFCGTFSNNNTYQTVSGSSYVLFPGALIDYPSTCTASNGNTYADGCSATYALVAGPNYIIIQ